MLDDKTLIMTVSTGRSGTGLLAKLFELAEDTCSVHEPLPAFQDVFVDGQASGAAALDFARDVKLPAIAAQSQGHYVETSHYFGQGFLSAFIELGVSFKLVILNRDPRAVAKSFERIKCIPMRTDKGRSLMPHPDGESALPLEGWERFNDYQLCYWYCLETEQRKEEAKAFAAQKDITALEIDLDELVDFSKFKGLCDGLGLTLEADAETRHAEVTATKVNRKGKYLPKMRIGGLDSAEEAVWAEVDKVRPDLRRAVQARYALA